MTIDPHIETLPAWVSAGERTVVAMTELRVAFPAAFGKVAEAVGRAGGQIGGPAYARYFGMPTDTVDVEIGFAIDRTLDLPGLVVTEHPETRAVVATHQGPYELLSQSYEEITAWFSGQELPLEESMFEFYDSPPEEDPATTITRIVFPLSDD